VEKLVDFLVWILGLVIISAMVTMREFKTLVKFHQQIFASGFVLAEPNTTHGATALAKTRL